MFDLEQAIVSAVRNLVESGRLTEKVAEHADKMLDDIVGDVLRSYSDLGKQIKEAVKKSLSIDPEELGLAGYNRVVLDTIRGRLQRAIHQVGVEKLQKDLDELLGTNAPETLKLSKLIEEFKEWAANWGATTGRCTIILEETQYKSRWLRLDREARKDKYQCQFAILIGQDGHPSFTRIEHADPNKAIMLGKLDGFAQRLFQLRAAGTKLEIDQEDFDDSLARDDYD